MMTKQKSNHQAKTLNINQFEFPLPILQHNFDLYIDYGVIIGKE